MTKKVRKLLMYLAIAVFLLVAPAVVLYAAGYSIDFAGQRIVMTGGFYLKTTPAKATIYLDDKIKDKTASFIKRLIPGEYQVRIEKDGYHSWHKKLRIEKELVTEARNILLVPTNPSIEVIDSNLATGFNLSNWLADVKVTPNHFLQNDFSGHAGYLVQGDDIYYVDSVSYLFYKNNLEGTAPQQLSQKPLPENQTYQVIYSSKRMAVLSDQQELSLFNPELKIFELVASDIKHVQFSYDNKKMLYCTDHEIWVYYLEDILLQPNKLTDDKELITRISQTISQATWYSATNEHIIYASDNTIKIAELDGRDYRNIVDLVQASPEQLIYDHQNKLIYYVDDNMLYEASLVLD